MNTKDTKTTETAKKKAFKKESWQVIRVWEHELKKDMGKILEKFTFLL